MLRDEIESGYTDRFGLILPSRPSDRPASETENATGNGLSYLAFYIALLQWRCELSPATSQRAREVIVSCLAKGTPAGEWILNRSPTHQDQNAWDDYCSIWAVLPIIGDGGLAQSFLQTGKKVRWPMSWMKVGQIGSFVIKMPMIWIRWYFNNEQYIPSRRREGATQFHHPDMRFNVSAWIGRFFYPVAQCYVAAGKKPPLLAQIVWAMVLMFGSLKNVEGDPGAWRINFLLFVGYRSGQVRTWIMDYGARCFERRLGRLEHPGDTQKGYFPDDHPFRVYWTRRNAE